MGLIRYFARHRTSANLLLVLMVVAGLIAATRIRAQYFPDVVQSEVTVTVAWEGAGAEDVDRGIVQILEPVFLALDGVSDVSSRATEGRAVMDITFETGTDLARAEADAQDAVDAIATLPEGAEEPEISASGWRDRVTDVMISGPVGVDQLARFSDELIRRLFAAGITRATIQGLASPETVVEVSSTTLMQHDLTMAEIAEAIAAAVRTAPAGEVGDGARVRTGTERRSLQELSAIVLRSQPDGSKLTLGEVAKLSMNEANARRAAFVGESPAMTVRIDRADDGDAIRMQAAAAKVAVEMQAGLPPGVVVELVRTRAEQISDRLVLLIDNGLTGLALVVGLLFLFLNARVALWVAAGIPVAMIASLAMMYAAGLTLNMISLFALIIMLGIVVDDAIVVGEHADFRARILGEPPREAAENAAHWMAAPVFASSVTTIVAFLGLIVIGGQFGGLIRDIPVTVTIVLIASLIECFLILPNHLVKALVHSGQEKWYDWPSRQMNRGMAWFQRRVIRPTMRLVIVARYPVLALAVVALASQAALFLKGEVQFRFFNAPEQASVTGNFAMLPGASRDDSLAMMRELQRATAVVSEAFEAEHGVAPTTYVLAEVGGSSGRGLAGADSKEPDLLGAISMELVSPDLRPFSTSQFVSALEAEVRAHPKLEELSFRSLRFGPGGDSLSVDLYGADAAQLKSAAEALKAELSVYPEVSGLEDSLAYDKEELVLNLTAQGQMLGFDTDTLARALRDRLNGIEAASYPDGPRQATIRVELPAEELTADFLDRTLMRAGPGVYVPLSDIVSIESRSGFSTVRRENGLRLVTVSGNLAEDDPARASEVQSALRDEVLPRVAEDYGVAWQLSGQAADERDFLGDSAVALVACLIGIYLTLAWIFGHWTRPLVVMSVIPFGLVGAIFGHWVWGVPMSLFSIVGLIGMAGIIINDAIVLVSTVDEYQEKRGLFPAIVDGVSDRFRPVLLTTLTTVLGLSPLLYEQSSQAEFLKPTVITLVFGLGFGMVLVLLVVPALMAAQDDLARAVAALRRMLKGAPARLRLTFGAALAGLLALALAVIGPVVVTGGLPGWVTALIPPAGNMSAMVAGFGLYLLGAAVIVLFAAGAAGLMLRRDVRSPR